MKNNCNLWLKEEHQSRKKAKKEYNTENKVFCVYIIEESVLTGMVWLPCRALIADWASACVENFTKAQPDRKKTHTQKAHKHFNHSVEKHIKTLERQKALQR